MKLYSQADFMRAAQAAVEELKAHFVLPFGLSPISADVSSEEQSAAQDDTPMPQAPAAPETAAPPGTPEEARAAQAASVREVMDQLRSENRFEVLQAGGSAAVAAHGGSLAPHGVLPTLRLYCFAEKTQRLAISGDLPPLAAVPFALCWLAR